MDVSLEDYAHDMNELGDGAARAVAYLREKVAERDRVILWLIRAAGGSISVPHNIMADLDDGLLVVEEDRANAVRQFRYDPPTSSPKAKEYPASQGSE